jgi:hypothetical protein
MIRTFRKSGLFSRWHRPSFSEATRRILWAAFLIALPVTSFPYFPAVLGGDALVRPLSIYPLILLFPLFVLPRLFNRHLPKTLLPLLFFILIAIASSLLSLLYGIEPSHNISVAERSMRGLLTLAIGCAIYLTMAVLPETIEDLRFSLRWSYAGCAIAMLWGSIQASHITSFNARFFSFMENVQRFISTRRLLYGRISGMTYEPHWFADQLILLVLPGTLAAVLMGYSISRWHKGKITLEWLLLGWILLLLPFTYSRAGLLNLIATILLSVFLFSTTNQQIRSSLRALGWRIAKICLVAIVIAIPIYIVGMQNEFFARAWKFWKTSETTDTQFSPFPLERNLGNYFLYLGFDTRVAYGEAAYKTYQAYPWLGVGLGNFGFFIQEMLPLRPVTTEVLRAITPDSSRPRLVTPKNFYLRLLAETGVIGTAAFLTFIVASLGCAVYLLLAPEPEWRYWGLVGLIGMIAFMISALTFDSFVIPNTWIVFGINLAAIRIYQQTRRTSETFSPEQLASVERNTA